MIGLVAVEVVARVAIGPPHYYFMMPLDPELGFRMQPGFACTNHDARGEYRFALSREGFRGPDLPDAPRARPDGEERIVFVGDSFVTAFGVRAPELMTTRTEAALRERGRSARVFALNSDDYGTAQELMLLERHGAHLAPDVVVLMLYPENDLLNNTPALAGRGQGDYLRPYRVPDESGNVVTRYLHPRRAWLRRRWRTFAVVEHLALRFGAENGIAWLQPFDDDRRTPPERVADGLAPYANLDVFCAQLDASAWSDAWRNTERLLVAFRDRVRALGARLLVVVIPRNYQVVCDAFGMVIDCDTRAYCGGRSIDSIVDWNLPERRLAVFFEREGIEARLLLGPLRRAATESDEPLYVSDGHLSGRGHGVVARAVVEWATDAVRREAVLGDGPIDRLGPAVDAPAQLALDTAARPRATAAGWEYWHDRSDGGGPGWVAAPLALAVLPARRGALFVRGEVPSELPLPVTIKLGVTGGASRAVTLDRAGRFEISVGEASLPANGGYVAVSLQSSTRFDRTGTGTRPWSVVVRALGIR